MPLLQENAFSTSGGSTLTVATTLPAGISAGSFVVVPVAFLNTANVPSVTDGVGNIYTLAGSLFTNVSDNWVVGWFYFYYATAPAPTASTITLSLTIGVTSKGLWALEYAGWNPAAVPQVVTNRQVAPGTGANALVSGTISPASALPYAQVGMCMDFTGTAGGVPGLGSNFNNHNTAWTFAGGSGLCSRIEDVTVNSTNPTQVTYTAGVGTDTYYTTQLIIAETFVPNTLKTNPLGLMYSSLTNVPLYENPSGMLVTGRERHAGGVAAAIVTARAAGAEVLAYLDCTEIVTSPNPGDDATFYSGAAGANLWPYPTYGARTNAPGTLLADITINSAWTNWCVSYISGLMTGGEVDGVFLDVCGAQLYTVLSGWTTWPSTEQNFWTSGQIDLVRRLDAARRALNPNFIIVNNGFWDRGDSLGPAGEAYVDGVCMEHSPLNAYHIAYADHIFSTLGHRRFLVIANSTSDAQTWALIQGVTHVSDQSTAQYPHPNVPAVGFNALTDLDLTLPLVVTTGPRTTLWTADGNYNITADGKGGWDASGYEPVPLQFAIQDAAALGVNLGPITTAYSPLVPVGYVITGYPPLIAAAPAGSYVPVVVSEGPAPAPTPAIVPNVVGKYYPDAQLAILAAAMLIATPIFVVTTAALPGYVIAQSLAPGSSQSPQTQLVITVSGFVVQNQGQAPIGVP